MGVTFSPHQLKSGPISLSTCLGRDDLGSQLCCFLAVWLWASDLASLSLGFHSCELGVIMPPLGLDSVLAPLFPLGPSAPSITGDDFLVGTSVSLSSHHLSCSGSQVNLGHSS